MGSQRHGSWQSNFQKLRQNLARTRTTPPDSSRSNGALESTIGHLTGRVRTLRAQLEVVPAVILNTDMCIWPWLTRHASWLMNRFSVRATGRTTYEKALDCEWKGGADDRSKGDVFQTQKRQGWQRRSPSTVARSGTAASARKTNVWTRSNKCKPCTKSGRSWSASSSSGDGEQMLA